MKKEKNNEEKIFSKEDVIKIVNKTVKKMRMSSKLAEIVTKDSMNDVELEIIKMSMDSAIDTLEEAIKFEIDNYFKTDEERQQESKERIKKLLEDLLGDILKD